MCNQFAKWDYATHKNKYYGPGAYRKWRRHRGRGRYGAYPPVNVQELDDRYELFLFAPGLSKGDFQIALADRLLTISVEKPKADEAAEPFNWRRREFRPRGFERKFELNDHIDTSAISAKYEEGILQITLLKLDDFHTKRQDIVVA
ncbi:MAG: Hsp20/alpha crystallin family protein [Bacteroidota bacterium]